MIEIIVLLHSHKSGALFVKLAKNHILLTQSKCEHH